MTCTTSAVSLGPRTLRVMSVPREVVAEAAAVVLGFLGLAIAWTWPLALRPGTTMQAAFGDPLLNAWILGWDADRLRHGLVGLWTAPSFYPLPDTLAYSEHLLGVAVPLAPLAWITGNPVLVYNVALIGSFALAGAGMYLLARGLTGRRDVSILAGLAFACCPYRAPQIGHLQVLINGWMPIALWALHRAFATGSRRALAGFAIAFLAQALSNGYFLFFLAVPVAMVAVVELIRHRAQLRMHVVRLALAAIAIGVVLAPVAASYLRVKHEQGLARTRGDAVQFGASPADYAHVSGQQWLWPRILPIGTLEKELFPGLTVVILALCVLVPPRKNSGVQPTPASASGSTIALYAAIGLVALLLSMGPEPALSADLRLPTGPWAWLAAIVPGFDGLRVPSRFAVVVYVALAALAAIGASRVLARLASPTARLAIVTVLGLAIVAEGMPARSGSNACPRPRWPSTARSTSGWRRSRTGRCWNCRWGSRIPRCATSSGRCCTAIASSTATAATERRSRNSWAARRSPRLRASARRWPPSASSASATSSSTASCIPTTRPPAA